MHATWSKPIESDDGIEVQNACISSFIEIIMRNEVTQYVSVGRQHKKNYLTLENPLNK